MSGALRYDASTMVRVYSSLCSTPAGSSPTFPQTLTTNALNISHLRRFEACFRQPTSAGLPPSFLHSAVENRNGSRARAMQGLSRISLLTHWVSTQIHPKASDCKGFRGVYEVQLLNLGLTSLEVVMAR